MSWFIDDLNFLLFPFCSPLYKKNMGGIYDKQRKDSSLLLFSFVWLTIGYAGLLPNIPLLDGLIYNVVLGALGMLVTYSDAYDYEDKNDSDLFNMCIKNFSFQGYKLAQALYFHVLAYCETTSIDPKLRLLLLFVATAPWLIPLPRMRKNHPGSHGFIELFKFIERCPYMFYKHFLLHGLNVSLLLTSIKASKEGDIVVSLVNQPNFRRYWLLLNSPCIVEAITAALVRDKCLNITIMTLLQASMVYYSGVAVVGLLSSVNLSVVSYSIVASFVFWKQDFLNTCVIATLFYYYM